MKTTNVIIFAAILAGIASIAIAGPSPQFANQPFKHTSYREANKPAANPAMTCEGCQTTQVREARQAGAPKSGSVVGAVVGMKHTCTHCGGEVKVVNGNRTNSMPNSCPMCGPDAALCGATVSSAKT
jgi:hypothetical protein